MRNELLIIAFGFMGFIVLMFCGSAFVGYYTNTLQWPILFREIAIFSTIVGTAYLIIVIMFVLTERKLA